MSEYEYEISSDDSDVKVILSSDDSDTDFEQPPPKRYNKGPTLLTQDCDCSVTDDSVEEPKVQPVHRFRINGINIEMPFKPYRSQECVIASTIQGLKSKQHCLLESPTGSGKTLALLCGALAWQKEHKKTIFENMKKANNDSKFGEPSASFMFEDSKNAKVFPPKDNVEENFDEDIKIPKIFYGSRTHNQLVQTTREFGRSSYKETPMTVLSSREHTCIQTSKRNKTELCRELLDPAKKLGCPYYTEDSKYTIGTNAALRSLGVPSPWDIEDLVTVGKKVHACPYFASKSLMEEAEIIFCPYNYIVDPGIRDSMGINLKGNIVILDEAHNIEDVCRSCGSITISDSDLDRTIQECLNLVNELSKTNSESCVSYTHSITELATKLKNFLADAKMTDKIHEDNYSVHRWSGHEFVNLLDIAQKINSHTINCFMSAVREASNAYNLAQEMLRSTRKPTPTLPHEIINILEKMLSAFKMITSSEYEKDYRIVVKEPQFQDQARQLDFICMNAAVVFKPLANIARTVVLASGTLSPMASYQSELGVNFPLTINADHVTSADQILVKYVLDGPSGHPLEGTFKNVNKWSYQDDLGAILLEICSSVPHGVLMFFSSYNIMANLTKRWKVTNVWNKVAAIKEIFQEERKNDEMAALMENYREVIRTTSGGPIQGITGALLMAVYRGKIAEGIDFSDNEARCVITVSIPFPMRFSPGISMKFEYNDKNRNRGLLSGSEWYAIQAFRALNQAVGRTIRHINDWGAIVLIDSRFRLDYNVKFLPSWVRKLNRDVHNNEKLKDSLTNFVAKQLQREKEKFK